jgi:hypothetical protein
LRQALFTSTLIPLKGGDQSSHSFSPLVQAFEGAATDGIGCQEPVAFSRGNGR